MPQVCHELLSITLTNIGAISMQKCVGQSSFSTPSFYSSSVRGLRKSESFMPSLRTPFWRCSNGPNRSVVSSYEPCVSGRLRISRRVHVKGCAGVGGKRIYPKIAASEFRHPLDQQNTAILQLLPGIENLTKRLLSPLAEQIFSLENIGSSVKISEDQLPEVHNLLTNASSVLGLKETPDLYIRQNPNPNAYTLALGGSRPFIVVHTSLVEILTPPELQAVLAHELGHLKCEHGVWLTLANAMTISAGSMPGFGSIIAQSLEEQLFRWLRAAELTCDRAACLVVKDPKIVVAALMKMAGGSPSTVDKLSVDAFLSQARQYDAASSSPIGWYLRNAQTRFLSHPLPVLRAREIDRWASSTDFRQLIKRIEKTIEQ